MNDLSYLRRRWADRAMTGLVLGCTIAVLTPLFVVLYFLVLNGFGALNLDFFTKLPAAAGQPGGGMANAIVGSLVLIGVGAAIGVPIGVLGGVFIAEFPNSRLGRAARLIADVMNGTPSIIVGVVAYVLFVLPLRQFSALAGGAALAIILIPIVMRTTDEMVRLVPQSLREAALALGVPHWRMLVSVVLRTAAIGILTGVLVGVARIAGETAPLLFTAFGNLFWSTDLLEPIAAMPLQIFAYARSPFADWHRQAWAGALVLVVLVLVVNAAARYAAYRQVRVR
jgi:phosphate transport system permease protein